MEIKSVSRENLSKSRSLIAKKELRLHKKFCTGMSREEKEELFQIENAVLISLY